MKRSTEIILYSIFISIFFFSFSAPAQQSCESLKSIKIPHVTITSVEKGNPGYELPGQKALHWVTLSVRRLDSMVMAPAPKFSRQEVPPGNVFLLSDNRLFPYDSRDYGSVPLDSCKETVFFRLVGIKGYLDGETRFTFIQ